MFLLCLDLAINIYCFEALEKVYMRNKPKWKSSSTEESI